jgi:hypothetical protein
VPVRHRITIHNICNIPVDFKLDGYVGALPPESDKDAGEKGKGAAARSMLSRMGPQGKFAKRRPLLPSLFEVSFSTVAAMMRGTPLAASRPSQMAGARAGPAGASPPNCSARGTPRPSTRAGGSATRTPPPAGSTAHGAASPASAPSAISASSPSAMSCWIRLKRAPKASLFYVRLLNGATSIMSLAFTQLSTVKGIYITMRQDYFSGDNLYPGYSWNESDVENSWINVQFNNIDYDAQTMDIIITDPTYGVLTFTSKAFIAAGTAATKIQIISDTIGHYIDDITWS